MSAQSHSHRVKVTIDVSENGRFPLLYELYKRAKGQLNSHAASKFSTLLLQEKAEKDQNATNRLVWY